VFTPLLYALAVAAAAAPAPTGWAGRCPPSCGPAPTAAAVLDRVDTLLAHDSLPEAARLGHQLLDSGAPLPFAKRARLAAMLGRFRSLDGELAGLDPVPGTTAALVRLAAGDAPAGITDLEARLMYGPGGSAMLGRGSALRALTELGFRRRGTGPALVATTENPAILLLVHRAARDSAGVRRLIAAADAERIRASVRNLPPPLALAEAEAWLGDTAAARARLAAFERSWLAMDPDVEWGMVANGWLLGRTWMLLGDLARAGGRPEDAARAYRRVVALWGDGDGAMQPEVTRARAALAESPLAPPPVAPAGAGRVVLRAAAAPEPGAAYRYDAAGWLPVPVPGVRDATQPAFRITLFGREQDTRWSESGITRAVAVDSARFDAPLLAMLGDDGIALRRQAVAASRGLRIETALDTHGSVQSRSLRTDAPAPDGLDDALGVLAVLASVALAPPFPARSVAVGATWLDTLALRTAGSSGERLAVTWRLARVDTIAGVPTAFLTLSVGGAGTQVSGELVYDLDAAVALRLAVSIHAAVRLPGAGMAPARILVTALRLPRVRDAAPAVTTLAVDTDSR
jgi:hypothetical protein